MQATANLLPRVFLYELLLTQALQLFFEGRECGFALFALKPQTLDFLPPRQHAAFGLAGTAHTQEIATDPITITADQALAVDQLPAQGQRLLKGFHRFDLPQPRRQIEIGLDLVKQAARQATSLGPGTEQAQITLGKTGQIQAGKIINQHRLQVRTQHGLDRQLPARLNPQPFGQTWLFGQLLLTQPLARTGAGVERSLLQGLKRGQATVKPLQLTLGLLLVLGRLLQVMPHLLQSLDQLFFAGLQLFLCQFAGRQLLAQLQNRRIFRVCRQQRALFSQTALTLGNAFHAGFQLLDTGLQDLGLTLRLGRALVETVPLFLPAVHGVLGHFQRSRGFFGGSARQLLLGLKHEQLFA